jgi:hypothetical protein
MRLHVVSTARSSAFLTSVLSFANIISIDGVDGSCFRRRIPA